MGDGADNINSIDALGIDQPDDGSRLRPAPRTLGSIELAAHLFAPEMSPTVLLEASARSRLHAGALEAAL
jgi:hypothetical protein